jgi:hypothetical protein
MDYFNMLKIKKYFFIWKNFVFLIQNLNWIGSTPTYNLILQIYQSQVIIIVKMTLFVFAFEIAFRCVWLEKNIKLMFL